MRRNVMHIFSAIGIAFVLIVLPISIAVAAQEEAEVLYQGMATVKAIDADKDIVKLVHGLIPVLNWPAMTMISELRIMRLYKGFGSMIL